MILYVCLNEKLTQERNRGTNRIFVPHDGINFPSNFHIMFFTASNSLNHVKKGNKQANKTARTLKKTCKLKTEWKVAGNLWDFLRND